MTAPPKWCTCDRSRQGRAFCPTPEWCDFRATQESEKDFAQTEPAEDPDGAAQRLRWVVWVAVFATLLMLLGLREFG
jgi:hypothetical protein